MTASKYSMLFDERARGRPDLHPVPTRRSSDLLAASAEDPDGDELTFSLGEFTEDPEVSIALEGSTETRSEEHTTELQSRGQLVCRLLLDKKKACNGERTIPLAPMSQQPR